jgi:alkylation response protein AidB-like acyl-CoA dehydrogenase
VSDATASADVLARVDRLLAAHPPASTDDTDFLIARFDAGLAWIADPEQRELVEARLRASGAPDPFPGNPIGVGMVGPTIAVHGTDEQRSQYLRRLWAGQDLWCQLFSEPGSGSDLPSLATRATADGEGWLVNGQKVWTSLADRARYGLLLARTDIHRPKRDGITAFLVDMQTPGVTVRPLRQMTGDAEFNEVFLEDVALPAEARLGPLGGGWRVATTTLMNERASIGSALGTSGSGPLGLALELYSTRHRGDPVARDAVARMYVESELIRWLAQRATQPGPAASVVKLFGTEHIRRMYEVIIGLLGPDAMLWEDEGDGSPWTRGPRVAFLRSRAATIEGGSSEVMRNILAEQVLGLPREHDPFHGRPWKDVPRS